MKTTDPRLVVNTLSTLGYGLSVGLHVTLLEVVGKFVQVLIIREKRVGLGACAK
jgi:hypothetical protein